MPDQLPKPAFLHAYLGSGSHRKVELGEEARQWLDLREQQPPICLHRHSDPACKQRHSSSETDGLHMLLSFFIMWQLSSPNKGCPDTGKLANPS